MSKRKLIFIRDVIIYTLTAFGGPHAHIAILLKDFVEKRNYISEKELMELNALTQILPGPSSTQTLIGIAYKVGGYWLAILTFFIWIIPSATLMCLAAIYIKMLDNQYHYEKILQIIQPVAIGIVAYASYTLIQNLIKTKTSWVLMGLSVIVVLILKNAFVFPLLILMGGIVSSAIGAPAEEDQLRVKLFANVNPQKVSYFVGILLVFAILGAIINRTSPFSLPIRLFENFYRNGILVFGGGQVLVPLMYTEFVEMKRYLGSSDFLTGYALQQVIPGPTFSFTSFLGTLTLGNNGYHLSGQIAGALIAVIGINTPGLILILFFVPFWDDLKKITRIKNSLSGINAVSVGFMLSAFFLLLPIAARSYQDLLIVIASFFILKFTPIKTPILVLTSLLIGIWLVAS